MEPSELPLRNLRRTERVLKGLAAYGRDYPGRAYVDLRASYTVEAYRKRREHYARAAALRGLAYREDLVRDRTARRLVASGIRVRARPEGAPVHTLAFFPNISWHGQLLEALGRLGPVSHFDYNSHGLRTKDLYARKACSLEGRRQACEAFVQFAAAAAQERPIDWIFVYALGLEIPAATLERVRALTGAPIVGMCLDDKQSWTDEPFDGVPTGQMAHAATLDLAWTSARVACEWYLVEGGNPVFLGEGCSPELYVPHEDDARRDIDVCFVGAAYGFRRWFVRQLQAARVSVATAGHGWSSGTASEKDVVALMKRSKVILGMGGIGWSIDLKNVKGRDFDAPCAGAYLTSFNPDLATMFHVGQEIMCYSSVEEAVELLRQLLSDSDRRIALARRGRARCKADHSWDMRFRNVLRLLGVFSI